MLFINYFTPIVREVDKRMTAKRIWMTKIIGEMKIGGGWVLPYITMLTSFMNNSFVWHHFHLINGISCLVLLYLVNIDGLVQECPAYLTLHFNITVKNTQNSSPTLEIPLSYYHGTWIRLQLGGREVSLQVTGSPWHIWRPWCVQKWPQYKKNWISM